MALALCAQVVVLLHQMRVVEIPWFSALSPAGGKSIGRVATRERNLKSRSARSLTWLPLAAGDPLRPQDTLLTGPASSAELTLDDRGSVRMESDTLLHLAEERGADGGREIALQLDVGRVRIAAGKIPVTFRVKEKKVTLAAGSEATITQAAMAPRAELRVDRGTARVAGGRGEEAVARAGDRISVAPAVEPRVEVAAILPSPAEERKPAALPEVRYSLRKVSGRALKLGSIATLEWAALEKAKGYVVQVARDRDFSRVLWEEKTASTSVRWKPSAPGNYFWRVRAEHESLGVWPVSPPETFAVKTPLAAPKPKAGKIKKRSEWKAPLLWRALAVITFGREARADSSTKVDLELEWDPVAGAAGYVIEVATDKAFDSIVGKKRAGQASVTLAVAPSKVYFWRVAAVDEDGDVTAFSVAEAVVAPPENPEVAKALPETRQPAKAGPPELQAPTARPSAPAKPAAPPAPALAFRSIAVGINEGYRLHRVSGGSLSVSESGLAVHRFEARADLLVAGTHPLRLLFWYQALRYRTNDAVISPFQPELTYRHLGFDGRLARLGKWGGNDLFAGVHLRREPDYERVGPETAAFADTLYVPFYAGIEVPHLSRRDFRWSSRLALQAVFLVGWWGGGAFAETSVGWPKLWGPVGVEAEFRIDPVYRVRQSRGQLRADVSATLLFKCDLGG